MFGLLDSLLLLCLPQLPVRVSTRKVVIEQRVFGGVLIDLVRLRIESKKRVVDVGFCKVDFNIDVSNSENLLESSMSGMN